MSDDELVELPEAAPPPLVLAHDYHSASGWPDFFSMVGHRYDATVGFAPPENMESWVVLYRHGEVTVTWPKTDWYTRTWMSPTGVVYVTDAAGAVHVNRNVREHPHAWETFPLRPVLTGVWGISDDVVFAWGKLGTDAPIFRWDGKTWTEIPNTGALVFTMHGTAPDAIYASCDEGVLSRWDGHAWHRVPIPTEQRIPGVFVVSPDEVYASGNVGMLLEGSSHGWGKVTEWKSTLTAVAMFAGTLWIAGGESGLLRRATRSGNVLEVVDPEVTARTFDVRGDWMLISCDYEVCATNGTEVRKGLCRGSLEALLAATPPMWLPAQRAYLGE